MLRVSKTEEDMASENGTDDRADGAGRTKGKNAGLGPAIETPIIRGLPRSKVPN